MFFKKKKKIEIDSKFHVRDMVSFRYHDELCFGFVYDIKLDDMGMVIYDIQVMGQCPWFANGIEESLLREYKQPNMTK